VGEDGWRAAIDQLTTGRVTLLGLWGEPATVHMALPAKIPDCGRQLRMRGGRIPERRCATTRRRCDWSERSTTCSACAQPARSIPDGGSNHNVWAAVFRLARLRRPAAQPTPSSATKARDCIRSPSPVHAGIIEPGHFRFTAMANIGAAGAAARLRAQGIESLMAGASLDRAASLPAALGRQRCRLCFAFARAVEAALDAQAPARRGLPRALMAELERLANHFATSARSATTPLSR